MIICIKNRFELYYTYIHQNLTTTISRILLIIQKCVWFGIRHNERQHLSKENIRNMAASHPYMRQISRGSTTESHSSIPDHENSACLRITHTFGHRTSEFRIILNVFNWIESRKLWNLIKNSKFMKHTGLSYVASIIHKCFLLQWITMGNSLHKMHQCRFIRLSSKDEWKFRSLADHVRFL